jgi:hypothetical protein
MSCQTFTNTPTATRGLYAISGYLCLVNFYSKTRHNSGSDKPVGRFPALEVMRLLLYYLALIRPVEVTFASELYGPQAVEDYSVHLWMHRGKVMDSHKYTNVLKHFTDLYLHVPLTVSQWRQLVKNIFRNILHINIDDHDEQEELPTESADPENSLVHMFGHDESRIGVQFYGRQYGHLGGNFDETSFANWLRSSIGLHNFLGLSVPMSVLDGSMLDDVFDRDMVQLKLNKLMAQVEDVLENAIQEKNVKVIVQKELSDAMNSVLLPSIQETVIRSLSPYNPNSHQEAQPILPVVSVHPQRVQTLRELHRDSSVEFKSPYQAELFELVCQARRHLIGVLPTGGGKSMAIFGPQKIEKG